MSRSVRLLATLFLLVSTISFAQANMNNTAKDEKNQAPPAARPVPSPTVNQPAVGKTGGRSHSIDVTTTSSTGVETPAVQTTPGLAQQPDKNRSAQTVNPQQPIGAPPNWEQAGQDEQLANANAAAAARAELGGPEGTLGVGNALPSYAKGGKPTGSSQTSTNQAQPQQAQRK